MNTLSKVIHPIHALGRRLLPRSPTGPHPEVKIGLALSGGFARGIAHIGVLKVLEEANIPISIVAGSSVGAFIGAMYCAGISAGEMEKIASCVRRRHFAQLSISRYGLFSNRRMLKFLNKVLRVGSFEELQVPLAVTATELSTGEGVVFQSGSLAEAVRASCAYPGLFPPVSVSERLLVDGGLTYPVPVQPLREMGCDRVIAVHLRNRVGLGGPRNLFDILAKSFAIAEQRSGIVWRSISDVVVEPDVRRFKHDDFERTAELVRAGETAMRAALPHLIQWFGGEQAPEMLAPAKQVYAPSTL